MKGLEFMDTKMKFETMEKIYPFAIELIECDSIRSFKQQAKANGGVASGKLLLSLIPIFVTEKRGALFGILSAISGKTVAEVERQDWEETKKLLESTVMSDVYDFLLFCVRMVKSV